MATEILMSFANAGLGSIFATWLRRRIMRHRGLYDTRSVYMDNIAMREQEGTKLRLDDRFMESDHGIRLIGAQNEHWNAHYLQAMSECSCMVVVATQEWSLSEWCWQEFRQGNAAARGRGSSALKRVALVFPETDASVLGRFRDAGWQLAYVEKVVVGGKRGGDHAEVSAHKGGWVIGENALQGVLRRI